MLRALRKVTKVSSPGWMNSALIWTLILSTALPAPLFAAPPSRKVISLPDAPTANNRYFYPDSQAEAALPSQPGLPNPEELGEQIAQAEARGESTLEITASVANAFLTQGQFITYAGKRGGMRFVEVGPVNLRINDTPVAPEVLERTIEVTPMTLPIENGAEGDVYRGIHISWKQSSWGEKVGRFIPLPDGLELVSTAKDSQYVYLVYNDGSLRGLDIRATRDLILKNAMIPQFPLFRVFTPETRAPETPLQIATNVRRVDDPDTSIASNDARFDGRARTRDRMIAIANPDLASRLNEQANRVEYVELADSLVKDIHLYEAADLRVIEGAGEARRVTNVVPQALLAKRMRENTMLFAALCSMARGDTPKFMEALAQLEPQAQEWLKKSINGSPLEVRELVRSTIGLAKVPTTAIDEMESRSTALAAIPPRSRTRDMYTPDEAREAAREMRELAEEVRIASDRNAREGTPNWLKRFLFDAKTRWDESGIKKAFTALHTQLQQEGVTRSLVWNAARTGVKETAIVTIPVAALTTLTAYIAYYHPVMQIPGYPLKLAFSAVGNLLPVAAIFGAAAVWRYGMGGQNGVGTTAVTATMRAYPRVAINPFKLICQILRQMSAFRAFKEGVNVEAQPIFAGSARREEAAKRGEKTVELVRMRRMLAMGLAMQAAGWKHGVLPGVVEQASEACPNPDQCDTGKLEAHLLNEAQAAEAVKLTAAIDSALSQVPEAEWQGILSENADVYVSTYRKAKGMVAAVLKKGTWNKWWNKVGRTVFQKMPEATMRFMGTAMENLFDQLAYATPSRFVVTLILSFFFVDYMLSLPMSMFMGPFADPAREHFLHARDTWYTLWSNPWPVVENLNQLVAHMFRGAAGAYLVYDFGRSKKRNREYAPVDQVLLEQAPVDKRMAATEEFAEIARLLPQVHKTNPVNNWVRTFTRTRIYTAWPAFLSGFGARGVLVAMGAFALTLGIPMEDGDRLTLEGALYSQLLFMACAFTAFGYVNSWREATLDHHETATHENNAAFTQAQIRLRQILREIEVLKMNREKLQDGGENVVAIWKRLREEMQQACRDLESYYASDKNSLRAAAPPARSGELYSVADAERLVLHAEGNPAVPHDRNAILFMVLCLLDTVMTTPLAMRLTGRVQEAMEDPNWDRWTGINWTNWDVFGDVIPQGDGAFTSYFKVAIIVYLIGYAAIKGKVGLSQLRERIPLFFNPPSGEARKANAEARAAAQKEIDDDPLYSRIERLGMTPIRIASDITQATGLSLGILNRQIHRLALRGSDGATNLARHQIDQEIAERREKFAQTGVGQVQTGIVEAGQAFLSVCAQWVSGGGNVPPPPSTNGLPTIDPDPIGPQPPPGLHQPDPQTHSLPGGVSEE